MEKKVYELTVDPDLRDYIPPLTESEFELLKGLILEEGCKEPLIVWNGIIVDGHNRYTICRENNIPFAIEEYDFDSKDDAKLWMAKRQLGRRNLKPFQRCELVYPLEKAISKRCLNLDKPVNTGETMAGMADVSRATWQMAKVVIEEGNEGIKEELRSAQLAISAAYKKIRKKEKMGSESKGEEKEDQQPETIDDTPATQRGGSLPLDPVPAKAEDKVEEGTTLEPITHIDHPFEVPPMRDEPERVERPFQFVRDQMWFAMENMIKEIQIGLNWLSDCDRDKLDELIDMLDDGFDRAEALIKKMEV